MSFAFAHLKKQFFLILAIAVCIFAASFFSTGSKSVQHTFSSITDTGFAGSKTCQSCHRDIYEKHVFTAHYLSSGPSTAQYIKGSFDDGKNHFTYNKFMEVELTKSNDSFFQTSMINNVPLQSESIDIVIGSGRKGQTYLYWKDDRLFQLPVSYYTPLDAWCNSPGYTSAMIRFDRPIPARCIECHGTYASFTTDDNRATYFNKASIIYGVDCERCHGPSAQHVAWHTSHPNEKTSRYTINPKLLNRQQRLDACALCHSGLRKEIKPAFSFMEGDKLEDYSEPTYSNDSAAALDVHGNQYGLLTSSKCFKMSQMDCSSCHNVHQEEINQPAVYSKRCMNCHNDASHNFCTFKPTDGLTLGDNCIDCHMPVFASQKIFLQLNDPSRSTPDFVRTHHVGIYPEKVKEFISKLKKQ